jgi:hypothetical protein
MAPASSPACASSERKRNVIRCDANIMTDDAPIPKDDPIALDRKPSPWLTWATPALSVAILIAVGWQFRSLDIDSILSAVPRNPWFWVVFALYYVCGIIFDFAIFRKLWGIPAEGLLALARKNVSNALLVDYLGEAYFYSWARKRLRMITSPFGAVKDVAILSALASNVLTLVMLAIALPFAQYIDVGPYGRGIAISVGIIVAISTAVVVFGKRLFSLSKGELWWVGGVHVARLITANLLLALCWYLAQPHVPLGVWVVLVTVKMLLGRLPLISNQDVIFAGVVVFLVGSLAGSDEEIKLLMAMMATLVVITHVIVGFGLAVGDLITLKKSSNGPSA